MVISKRNIAKNRDLHLQILTAWCMKLKQKIFVKILVVLEKSFILVVILINQTIMMIEAH